MCLSWVKMCLPASFATAPAFSWVFLQHTLATDILCDLGKSPSFSGHLLQIEGLGPDDCSGLQFQLLHSKILAQE